MSSIAMSVFIDCLSVRLHFLRPTRRNFTELSVHVTGSRGSVLWCQCDTLCTSGFEDYVVFSPNGANIPITDSVSSNSPGGDTGIVWGSLPCQTASCYGDDANHRYCNSLLVNCSNRNLHKLQRRVQDNLAGVVCNSNRSTYAGPLLPKLQWLPVRQRINFELAKLCYLVTSFQQPGYLADLISPYSRSRLLRSSTQNFCQFSAQLGYCSRRFSVAALRLWKKCVNGLCSSTPFSGREFQFGTLFR